LDEFLQKGQGMMWIAEQPTSNNFDPSPTETPVWAGCIAVVPSDEMTGRLRFMLVAPAFRGCGLGRQLLETALEYCRERGYKTIALSTAGDCRAAHKLYTQYGFEAVNISKGTNWGGISEEWWEKQL